MRGTSNDTRKLGGLTTSNKRTPVRVRVFADESSTRNVTLNTPRAFCGVKRAILITSSAVPVLFSNVIYGGGSPMNE